MTQIRLITMQQAADTYNVSVSTIRRYIASGQLVGYRIGPRLIKVDAEQAAAMLLRPAYSTEQAAAVLRYTSGKESAMKADNEVTRLREAGRRAASHSRNNKGDSPK